MMDCRMSFHEDRKDLFNFYVDKHSKTSKSQFIKPSLLMTWAYKDVPEMIGLSSGYISAGNRNKVMVFPSSLAFDLAQDASPDDRSILHQIKDIRVKLVLTSSAVIYSSIYNVSPIGNSYDYGIGQETQSTRNRCNTALNRYFSYKIKTEIMKKIISFLRQNILRHCHFFQLGGPFWV